MQQIFLKMEVEFIIVTSGFPLAGKLEKVVAGKGAKKVSSYANSDKTQITVLVEISAAGVFLPPTIMYAGQRFKT